MCIRDSVTPFASAHDTPPSPGTHFLRWAIVSHGSTSNSDTDLLEGLDRLKRKYGDEFLYIWRDDQGGFVIRDRSMVERAYRALTAMRASGLSLIHISEPT